MKSIKKELIRPVESILLIILLLAAAGFQVVAQSAGDIVEFYWKQSARRFAAADPGQAGLRYRLSTFSLYKNVERGGKETVADSAAIDYYFTGTTLDSQTVRSGNLRHFKVLNPSVPDIFTYPYRLSTFPNDDGNGALAINLDTDSADVTQPTGLLLIDRNLYDMTGLFLFYDEFEDFDRFTQSYGFTTRDGYVFADTTWIIAARPGILSPEHFKIETAVNEFEIYD